MTQLDMLSGLLRKDAKSNSMSAHLKANISVDTQKPVLEISQSPKMNLFKVSGGIQDVPEHSREESELAQEFFQKQAQSRHINLGKNDYLNKLFNDIKKTQHVNSGNKDKEDKEEVFNDTFGQGGNDAEGNKENVTPQPQKAQVKSVPAGGDRPSPSTKRGTKSPNIFKQMKKCQTEIIYEKISGQADKLRPQGRPMCGRKRPKGNSEQAAKTGRKCVLSIEKDRNRKLSKRSSRKMKAKNMKFGDTRRSKLNT